MWTILNLDIKGYLFVDTPILAYIIVNCITIKVGQNSKLPLSPPQHRHPFDLEKGNTITRDIKLVSLKY